ncbi:hypothetical protein PERCYII29_5119 [Pseudomonas aeruginosa]|nr:hypothetical protein PERCYII29_5119 [Pseudomonas aeruginosa]
MQSSQLLPLGSLLLSFATPLAQADALHDQASALFKPIPEQVTELRGQPISEQQRELGKKLFFDPRLSRSHVLSCNTCHNVGTGGADNVPTSVGHGWQKGPRNSPTVFNAVFNAAQFWDGRAKDLGEQAKGPIQNSVEMHSTPQLVEQTWAASRNTWTPSARPSPRPASRSASTTWRWPSRPTRRPW